ncbi:F-box protein At2g32560-like [Euphorbia lathyris]|uniref:F-box protein At2g32560-like n=1 Tax=Euphorbia lathyris TaxID=212925 RepID=UPI00331364AE
MVLFWIFCFPLIFFFKSFSFNFKPPLLKIQRRFLLPLMFLEEFMSFLVSLFHKVRFFSVSYQVSDKMPLKKTSLVHVEEEEEAQTETTTSLLVDLPELALDCILQRLPAAGLCSMAGVCSSLREKCVSDHLWIKHLNSKWGRLIGDVAFNEWQWRLSSRKKPILDDNYDDDQIGDQKSLFTSLATILPFSWIKPKIETTIKPTTCLPNDSIMALYLSLERGNFWFPAQVYNRENGHVGFLLSCYDAQISYDSQKDTFQARYSPYGRRMIEDSIKWNRLRAPPVDISGNDLHISDCLNELKPGDHIEIQWRRSREFPYGWWYAVVGHIESCDGNQHHCGCHYSDNVVLEFKQYPPGSRWRQTMISRKDHKEEGNEADGFYGGIRRLQKEEDISKWKQLWPTEVSE